MLVAAGSRTITPPHRQPDDDLAHPSRSFVDNVSIHVDNQWNPGIISLDLSPNCVRTVCMPGSGSGDRRGLSHMRKLSPVDVWTTAPGCPHCFRAIVVGRSGLFPTVHTPCNGYGFFLSLRIFKRTLAQHGRGHVTSGDCVVRQAIFVAPTPVILSRVDAPEASSVSKDLAATTSTLRDRASLPRLRPE